VTFGLDNKGSELSSLVLMHVDAKAQSPFAKPPQPANQYAVWSVLREQAGTASIRKLIDMAVPRLAYDPMKRDQRRSHLRTAIATLARQHIVEINDDTVSFVGSAEMATAVKYGPQPGADALPVCDELSVIKGGTDIRVEQRPLG
jgi:hypothetical protein